MRTILLALALASLARGPAAAGEDPPRKRAANRLIHEKSPYLLQHAYNPVNWYPWGEEAFKAARESGKPVFLSIGYSTCHWCHVMERESFENDAIAAILNESYICIKVDREERPDIDDVYMKAVLAVTGNGGWPLSAFLTADGRPFYLGTYYPPEDHPQRGRGFRTLLLAVKQTWDSSREKILQSAEQLAAHLDPEGKPLAAPEPWNLAMLRNAYQEIQASHDDVHGGFGQPPRYAPKFPRTSTLDFLMAYALLSGEARARDMATGTLRRMAAGGIRDHLGGGFHRYSTDREWLVPHFEKMLYDNALIACSSIDAFRLTGEAGFLSSARQCLDYLLGRMRDPAGGFYSAEDADSEGVEGKYYVFKLAEVMQLLGERDGKWFADYYGMTADGNFETAGDNILHAAMTIETLAVGEKVRPEEIAASLESGRRKLLAERDKRVPPFKDDKVLADWNGLAISALSQMHQVTEDSRYLEAAKGAAVFILKTLRKDGRLLHRYRAGQADFPAYLEDHAFLAVGLIDLYESALDAALLEEAVRLAVEMIGQFWDERNGGFFQTGPLHEKLLVRGKDFYDGAIPSGNAMAAQAILRLASYTDNPAIEKIAALLPKIGAAIIGQSSESHPQMLLAAARSLLPRLDVLVVGPDDAALPLPSLKEWRGAYQPSKRLALATPGTSKRVAELCPWVQDFNLPEKIEAVKKTGKAAVFVRRP